MNDTATMDFLRVADEVLSADAMKALASVYPYISKNGSATRSFVSSDTEKDWITAQPVWQQTILSSDGSGETSEALQIKPNDGTNLKLMVLDDTTVKLNLVEDVAYESLNITGVGSLLFERGREAHQMVVSGRTIIETDVTIDTSVIKFGALFVAEGKTLTFDFSTYDFSQFSDDTFIPLTGLLSGDGEVKVLFPAEKPGNVVGLTSYKDRNNGTYGIFVSVVGEVNGALLNDCDWEDIIWTVDSAEINNLNWENAILTTKIMVDTDVELDIDEVVALKALKLKGQGNLTICIKENGAFKPNTIDDSEYEGELRFVIEQGAKQTYFLGSERNVYNGDYLPFLSYETEVLSGGEIGFTYEGMCYSLMNSDFSKLTGNGLISFDSLYVGDMNWAVLPSNCFAETLQLKNDSDILLQPDFSESRPLTVRNLSGNGRFRCDAFTGGERCLKVTQTKNSIFSGYFVANDNSSYLNREICLCVSSDAADADYSLKRLILSGDSDLGENSELSGFATLRDSKGTLTIEKSGALELNYIWGGDGIVAGILGGNGGFASNVTFMTGARIVLPKDGVISIAGRVTFGENLIVQSEGPLDEPRLVLDFLNSAINREILNTKMTLCVDGVIDEYAEFILTEDGLYVIPCTGGEIEPMVRFDVGNHGHRIGGGRLVQFPAHQTEIIPPTISADDGWVFVGWDVSLNSLVSGGQATAQYKTLKPDLHVRDVVVQAAAQTGEAIEINWTLSNTGNPNWEGKLVEQIRLVNVANPENKVVIADIVENVTVDRDGETDRSYIWNIPLKGLVGEWIVEIETAIESMTEHGGENTDRALSTLTIAQCPLPELLVKSITLDRESDEYLPMDTVKVRYMVQNIGTATATAPWQDRLYLFKNGTRITLATREETESLEAGAEVEREITCTIPELIALSGDVSFVVKVDSNDAIVELEERETDTELLEETPNAILGKRLYLSFVTDTVKENASSVRFYAKRSGEVTAPVTVTFSATGATSAVTYPESLTIKAGTNVATGIVIPIDNQLVDGTRQVAFTLKTAIENEFVTEEKSLLILDNEEPKLTLSFDKTSLREGDGVITVTVTRELVTNDALLVYLSGVPTSQCAYPTKIEIPAGEASYTFELEAVNNATAEILADLSLRASAVGYVASEQTFKVEDDDVPSVTLTIYPEEVSEGAGVNAAYAELSRIDDEEIGSPITINLTPSLMNQILLPTTVTIPAYTKTVRFAIGVIDNGIVDGIDDRVRDVKVTGSIYIESCGCSGQPSSGDVIESNLRIIDNDGPALSLSARPSTMKEGLEDAGELILKHNSTLTEDLVVALSVDTVGEVEIPQSVVIPAGETSICIPVKTLDDGETDGGKLVSIYADDEKGIFAPASTWIQVSDQNLPDLKVEKIEVSTGILAGKPIDGAFNLSNIGFVPCNFDVMYSVHLVDAIKSESATEKNKICSGVISEKILPGTLNVIHFTGQPSMVAGDYRIIVQLNQNGAVAELDKVNNTVTSDVFTIMAAYDVTVMAERETYLQKENILLKGMVTTSDKNMAVEGLPVVVTILHNGYARKFDIRTGAQGTFTCMFNPSPSESGNYVVMAAAPGVTQKQPQDEFDILGIELVDKSPLVWDNAVVGSTHEWNVLIRNTSNTPLTNLIINQQNVSKTCSIECTLPNMLEGNEVVPLTIKMMALAHSQNVATRSGYEEITLSISSAEGGQLEIPLYFFGITQQASLVLNPMKLDFTMVKNETRYLSFVIKNEGMGDSGEIKVEIPSNDWMSVVGGKNIKNLKQGEEGVVTLALAPLSDGMIVNREYSGTMVVRCENGPDCELPFAFLLTSEKRATLKLDVVNVLTFTVDGKPHVEGAKVTLYDVYGKVLDVAETDKTGICLFEDVMEGLYTLSIDAKKHNSKKIEVNVLPGIVNEKTVFLDYRSVEYTWKVVPTEIEDQYEVKLEMEYETNVPYPVVIIHVPEAIPSLAVGESHVAEITLENKGLVALQDVYFDLDDPMNILEQAGYEYEQLSPDIKILPALSSETVFVRFTKSTPTKNEGVQLFDALEDLENLANKVGFDCAIGTKIEGVFLCGEEFLEYYERSPDIKIKDALCNLSYYLLNALSDLLRDWLPSTSVVRRGDGPSSVEVTQKNPIISEGDACEQYLNYLHRLSSAYLSSNRIFDYAYKGIQLVEGKNIDLLVDLFFDVAPEINSDKPFAKIVEWTGTYRSLRSEFDELAAEYENLPMKKAKEMLEKLEVYYQIAERILDAADVFFGSPKWYVGNNVVVLLKYLQEKKASANVLIADDDLEYFALENSLDGVSREDLVAFKRRWNSISSMSQLVQLFSSDEIDGSVITALRENFEALKIMLQENGYSSVEAMRKDCEDQLTKMLEGGDVLHICSKVTLELSQTMAMTREAFIGTLGIQSSEFGKGLENVMLELCITDVNGVSCNDYFGISDKTMTGFVGTSILNATASLEAGALGEASVLFVPTNEAAPEHSQVYYFGGVLKYYDIDLQKDVSVKLSPIPLQVNPSPILNLDYFIQRDVYGDDPFTEDVVEPSMPAEFAVLVRNTGYGDAKNVRIDTVQPKVIENTKGVAIDFELKDYTMDASALNGVSACLPLQNVNLGTIESQKNAVAQWWFTSSLEGHFSGVKATLTHLNSWGNPDTSLIGSINTHRLVRSLTANEDALPDFLTSEDLFGAPTELYLSSGEVLPVHSAVAKTDSLLVGQNCSLQLTIHASEVGWNYASINLLNASLYTVEKVERDGVEIDTRSVWITDRTFRDGLPKLEQELMHIAVNVDELGEHTYTIYLRAKPSDVPEVKAFNIESGMIEYVARESVIVEFSKVIEPSTFTVHDLTLLYQGHRIDNLSSLTINCLDDTGTKFVISGLSELCKDFGRYELIVQCAEISDVCGQLGTFGKSVSWILSRAGSPYILDIEGRPMKRVQQIDGVTVVLSHPVVEDSVKQCAMTLNGVDISQQVTIQAADNIGTRFKIEGLDALQLKDGDYTFIIDGANLMGANGEQGIGSYEFTWARDTTNPELTDFRREKGVNGTLFNLKFTEDVTITSKNIRLTHKADASKPVLFGGTKTVETLIELPATAKLTSLSNGDYVFSGIDSVILEEGTYTLTVDLTGVTDEAGNLMSGERSITWTVDTTAPCEVTNLEVSSSHGTLDTCIYTANEALTIRGTVPERELQVQIFAKYIGGDEILLAEPEIDEYLQFVANLSLPGSGNMTVIIRLTNAYGISTDTMFDVYVDVIDLVATISGMPESTVADELTITFLNGVPDEVTVLNAEKTLTLNDVEIPIPDVVITKMTDDTYVISGLSAYTTEYGTYKFSYDVRDVKKLTSGVTGNSIVTVSWANIQQDTIPPTVTSILFDGKIPEEAYVTNQMFNEVTIRFSEEVNIENLIALGLAGQVFSIHYLSDTNDIVGTLNAKDVIWDVSTHSARCLFDGVTIPCGKARFVIDSSLITDVSGNKLAMTDVHEVISGAKVYTASLLKQSVAYAYACPTLYDWNNDGLLDLLVGEKTVDMYGKVRIYLNRGTATSPNFDDYTYLKRDGKDVAFQAQGCVGMQVSFYDRYRAVMILADSSGKIYSWDYLNRNPETNLSYDWELLFDHSTDERFSNLIRTQTFCCDFDDDGEMEIIVSGQNSPMFWMEQEYLSETEEVVTKCTPLVDIAGNVLLFPEGQRHASAVLTDVNGDAIRDLVTGDSSGNVWVYYGTNDKRFMTQPVMIYQNPESANSRSRLTVGDLNGDGLEDLLVGRQDGSIVLLEGKGNLSPAVNFKCVAIKTIEEALNNHIYWIDGAQGWICEQFGEDAQAKVSHDANGDKTILSAKFTGKGTVVFTWAVTGSAQNSTFKCIGGDSEILRTGPFSLITQSVSLSESRTHTLSWVFEGKNDAIIKGVSFIPFDESEQVTKTSEVPIPFADIHQFANVIWKQNEGDYEKAVHAIAANGKTVMDNCIAGVDSSDALAHFYAKITMTDDGEAKISWHPALNGEVDNEGVPNGIRIYKIYGKETLEQNNWSLLTPENRKQMFFFKVTVEMP